MISQSLYDIANDLPHVGIKYSSTSPKPGLNPKAKMQKLYPQAQRWKFPKSSCRFSESISRKKKKKLFAKTVQSPQFRSAPNNTTTLEGIDCCISILHRESSGKSALFTAERHSHMLSMYIYIYIYIYIYVYVYIYIYLCMYREWGDISQDILIICHTESS